LGLKTSSYGLVIYASKLSRWFLGLGLKTKWYGLSVVPQNRREDEDGEGHASRSSGLLRVEASRARVSQSGVKAGGGTARMVHVASLWRLH
jgi:hypothetical protein